MQILFPFYLHCFSFFRVLLSVYIFFLIVRAILGKATFFVKSLSLSYTYLSLLLVNIRWKKYISVKILSLNVDSNS